MGTDISVLVKPKRIKVVEEKKIIRDFIDEDGENLGAYEAEIIVSDTGVEYNEETSHFVYKHPGFPDVAKSIPDSGHYTADDRVYFVHCTYNYFTRLKAHIAECAGIDLVYTEYGSPIFDSVPLESQLYKFLTYPINEGVFDQSDAKEILAALTAIDATLIYENGFGEQFELLLSAFHHAKTYDGFVLVH